MSFQHCKPFFFFQVFNHLAESISTFMEEENIKDRHMQLGELF